MTPFAQRPMPLPSAITYGRKRRKLIPLAGNHFIRSDSHKLPPDDGDERQDAPRRVVWGKVYSAREPDPDDAPLSEDELEAVYGRDAGPTSSPPRHLPAVSETGPECYAGMTVTPPRRRRIPQPTSRVRRAIASLRASPSKAFDGNTRRKRRIIQTTPTISDDGNIRKQGIAKPTHHAQMASRSSAMISESSSGGNIATLAPSTATQKIIHQPLGSLPVNELLLARSVHRAEATCDRSSPPGVDTQDTIEPSSTAVKRAASAISDDENPQLRAPLTSIRKRLKTPKSAHKSVVALRKKHDARSPFSKIADKILKPGDGFEISELKIANSGLAIERRRKFKPLALSFSALTISSGPLPDVQFKPSSPECRVEHSRDGDAFLADDERAVSGEASRESNTPDGQSQHPGVSFGNRVLDDMVAQRLSSVSAPKRVYSISSDDEDDDGKEDDWNQSEEESDPEADGQFIEPDKVQSPNKNQMSNRHLSSHFVHQQDSAHSKFSIELPRNSGVTLDFRKPTTPGSVSELSSRRHLIEVDERIFDGPCANDQPVPRQIIGRERVERPMKVTRFAEQQAPVTPHRPRSILRCKPPIVQESDTGAEHTSTNTRLNSSCISQESVYFNATADEPVESSEPLSPAYETESGKFNDAFELDQGRYFSTAARMLRDQALHRPRVIKQRSSEARRASYLRQREGFVPGSDAVVLETSTAVRETSPDPPDHTDFRKMDIPKRTSSTMCTSNLPRISRDLKTLTRTVSKEHGTLSQSARRRRPSLPFQSPVKQSTDSHAH